MKYLYESKGSVVIARKLNELNIPYRTGNKKSGGTNANNTWSKENVLDLLKNPILAGHFRTNVTSRWIDENGKRHAKRNKPSEDVLQETDLLREIILNKFGKILSINSNLKMRKNTNSLNDN